MGQITLMLTLAVQPNGQLVFEGFFVGLGQSVSGLWGATNDQVKLVGWRFVGGPWRQRMPYETTVAFASWSNAQLQGHIVRKRANDLAASGLGPSCRLGPGSAATGGGDVDSGSKFRPNGGGRTSVQANRPHPDRG